MFIILDIIHSTRKSTHDLNPIPSGQIATNSKRSFQSQKMIFLDRETGNMADTVVLGES